MTSDISHAFDHPEARAAATEGDAPRDRISLRGHVVEAEIGAFQQERGRRQRLRFDVVVEVRPEAGPLTDDVDRILSYDRITEAISHELEAERINLLETLAERIAERLLLEDRAMRVFVRVEKLDRGPGALGVEIVRTRGQVSPLAAQELAAPAPHPLIVHMSNAAIAAPHLPRWLDALEGAGRPVILTVGAPDAAAPEAGAPAAQRRIDLLAIEQNAWALAARDRRCLVVGTRTEIDWAMKHGQMIVWAPSKLVLDTAGAPGSAADPLALAAWFAGEMAADELIVLGGAAPDMPQGIAARGLALPDGPELAL